MNCLCVESRDGIKVLVLNRPKERNAVDRELRSRLQYELTTAGQDVAVSAVVITGKGETFSAGLDLRELRDTADWSPQEHRRESAALAELLYTIYTLPKPVIAAVNGHAVAAGAGLATACDYLVMSRTAKLGYTETRIGFVPALVGVFLVRQVGERVARRLLLSGTLVTADEALDLGLVDEICESEDVLERALGKARALVRSAPTSLAMSKQLLANIPGMAMGPALAYAVELNTSARCGRDLREGIAAFFEKRDPTWTA